MMVTLRHGPFDGEQRQVDRGETLLVFSAHFPALYDRPHRHVYQLGAAKDPAEFGYLGMFPVAEVDQMRDAA